MVAIKIKTTCNYFTEFILPINLVYALSMRNKRYKINLLSSLEVLVHKIRRKLGVVNDRPRV